MSQFLETLKARLADAQKRFQVAQQEFQRVQAEFQALAQELASWQNAVQAETRAEQQREVGGTSNTPTPPIPPQLDTAASPIVPHSPSGAVNAINKTEIIRHILRQHPTGITPAEMWAGLHGQVTQRAYLYSILKRLKDKGEATERRGKYYPKINLKPEDGKERNTPLVQ